MPKYVTKQRKLLTEYLARHTDESLSTGQIAEALADTVSKSAVYRNLAELETEGKLRRVAGGGGREAVYQYSDAHSCEGRLHLSCKKCGKTVHMEKQLADALVSGLAVSDHFAIDKGETIIYGVCGDCNKAAYPH